MVALVVHKIYRSGAAEVVALRGQDLAVARGDSVGGRRLGLSGAPGVGVWADEPTGTLDTAAEGIVGLLTELHAAGMILVLVTHDPAVAARARRRVSMRDGYIVEDTGHVVPRSSEGGYSR